MDTLELRLREEQHTWLSQWHDEIRQTVRTSVRRHVRITAEADEVEQEVMLELWVKGDQIEWSAGCPHGWASTVAKRRAIDHIRSDRSRTSREDRVARENTATISLVAEDVIVRLDRAAVVDALDVLNPKQREAIVLAYFGERSYAEVARSLGLPVGTVKRRIRDGMARLRAELSDLR